MHSAYVMSYPRIYKTCHPWFSLHFLLLWKKTPPIIKFYGVFNHFYELVKSLTIKLYHWVSDVIRTNEQTKYVTCDLNVNFWNFLQMPSSYFGLRSPWILIKFADQTRNKRKRGRERECEKELVICSKTATLPNSISHFSQLFVTRYQEL